MEAAWFPVDDLPGQLAFDNDEILHYALQRLRNKVEYAHVAFQFLAPHFTMAQLRAVYEVILGRRIDPTNFRRRVEATGTIVPTGDSCRAGGTGPRRSIGVSVIPEASSRPRGPGGRSVRFHTHSTRHSRFPNGRAYRKRRRRLK